MWMVVVLTGCFAAMGTPPENLEQQLKAHVRLLASDSLQGRGLGTEGAVYAREYIAAQMQAAGLEAFQEDYIQQFQFRSGIIWATAYNIVGVVRGTDPVLKDEYIVIGAHYDHLGYSLNADRKRIFPGADDNASGVAAILEIGSYFAQNPHLLKRSLIIVAFDAEETGLNGSNHFVNNSPVPLEQIKLMFSLDMVGMYKTHNGLDLRGMASLVQGEDLARLVAQKQGLRLKTMGRNIEERTDTAPFGAKGIPAVHVFTGMKSPYHKPGDTYDLLDYQGMAEISLFMKELLALLSAQQKLQAAPSVESFARQAEGRSPKSPSWGAILHTGSGYHRYKDQFFRANSIVNVSTGLYLQLPLTRTMTLQQEFLYDFNGSAFAGGDFRRHALTLPLNLQLGTPRGQTGPVRLFAFAGAYYRHTLAGRAGGKSMDFEQSFEREEWGYSFGCGVDIMRFNITYTARRGLTSLLKNNEVKVLDANMYFTLGYKF